VKQFNNPRKKNDYIAKKQRQEEKRNSAEGEGLGSTNYWGQKRQL